MATKLLLYTTNTCQGCKSMKSALERLGVGFTEIILKNGMTLPPDVRGVPTLAMEIDGSSRTTLCIGWPGSVKQLKKALETLSTADRAKHSNNK